MPPTTQEKITTLRNWIKAVRGNDSTVPKLSDCTIISGYGIDNEGQPMPCNIVDINGVITKVEERIRDLILQLAGEELPGLLDGMVFMLNLGPNSMPTLSGRKAEIVTLINSVGNRPSAIEVSGVTISVSGADNVVLSVKGNNDVEDCAAILAAFLESMDSAVDFTQIIAAIARSTNELNRIQETLDVKTGIKTAFDDVTPAPTKPQFIGDAVVEVTGKVAKVTFAAEGTAPITFEMDWNNNGTKVVVTSPATYTYAAYDTAYTAKLTATNAAGYVTKNISIRTEKEQIASTIARFDVDYTDDPRVEVDIKIDGYPASDCEIVWGDGNGTTDRETVLLDAQGAALVEHTYSTNDDFDITITATNGVGSAATQSKPVTIAGA